MLTRYFYRLKRWLLRSVEAFETTSVFGSLREEFATQKSSVRLDKRGLFSPNSRLPCS